MTIRRSADPPIRRGGFTAGTLAWEGDRWAVLVSHPKDFVPLSPVSPARPTSPRPKGPPPTSR
ncbi:hypothetical protein [Novosphingobium sp.]|uniref:hypothetical protein n=1 Tax=Novosphingobium sp. TaxID=1874826 RepID=UPI003D6D852B